MAENINRKIEKAKRELEHMIDLNPSIMLLVDRHGNIIRANKALLKLVRADNFTNILNKKIENVFDCTIPKFFHNLLRSNAEEHGMEALFTINNSEHILRFTVVESGSDGELQALIINDVTGEKEEKTHLEKEHKKEAVKALVGALLHNINQPLTVIMMRAQLMHLELEKGKLQPAELTGSLRDIMRLTTDIAALLRQVEMPGDYVTEHYSRDVDILDIKRSAGQVDFDMASVGIPQTLILALDIHNPGAQSHAMAVQRCAFNIACRLKLNEIECNTVKRCACLHDIGKLGVPAAILNKPGPLDEKETVIMRKHPETGYRLLNNFHFLRDEAETAYTHAEWYDGSGYPRGLAGEEIPMRARITAVADTYSALTETRPYRDAVPEEEAIEEISSHAGSQFDPEVVHALKNHSGLQTGLTE